MKPLFEKWTLILLLSAVSAGIMVATLYIAAWLAGITIQTSVAAIIGCVTAAIMVFVVRRQMR